AQRRRDAGRAAGRGIHRDMHGGGGREVLALLADEFFQWNPTLAQELLVRLVAVDEDVGEEDDSGGIGVLETDAQLMLEDGHVGLRARGELYTGRGYAPPPCRQLGAPRSRCGRARP